MNELKQIGKRWYVVNPKGQKKMIPEKYSHLWDVIQSKEYDFTQVYLTKAERFLFEVWALKFNLMDSEPLLYDLIKDKKVTGVRLVKCKFAEDRYEATFGKYNVKCSKELYNYAKDSHVTVFYSYY